MSARVALCVDSQSCTMPEIVGLDGESLETQGWMSVFCTGEDARREVAGCQSLEQVWVVSSDDVDPINLAATLKADRPTARICLVGEGDGSMRSRAYTASIDEVLSLPEFVEAYRCAKAQYGASVMPTELRRVVASELPQVRVQEQRLPCTPGATVPKKQKGKGFLMPVVSGSGGSGKSTVSTLSALIAQRAGYRTLLLDYDLQFGDVATALGVEDALPLDELVAHPDLAEGLMPQGVLPAIVAPPKRIEAAELLAPHATELIEQLRSRFDVVVANTGAAWAEHHAVLLEQSTTALFLVDQRSTSLRACKHALQLCGRCGIATGPFRFALNRCSRNALFTSIDVSCALRGATAFELRDGGPAVEECFAAGVAVQLVEEGNELCTSLAAVLEKILPEGDRKVKPAMGDARQRRGGKRRGRHFKKGGEPL